LSTPLLPLHATHVDESPLLCIPGAGASVTGFVELLCSLGQSRPVYGLQPRGVDLTEAPDASVEDAALYTLRALAALATPRAVHLLGHSYGGLVAFEMARRLHEQGRPVASLTVIDTEPPGLSMAWKGERTTADIFREFVDAFEQTFHTTLAIDQAIVASEDVPRFLSELHARLVRASCMPASSTPDMLRGPLATFTAAARTIYTPPARYPGTLHLVLVRGESTTSEDDLRQRCAMEMAWRPHVARLDVWNGPGHHFSILQAPHAQYLGQWWQSCAAKG
jgi:thioesterase domain-containing protein